MKRQAVVVIHGIGEQTPMGTLRGLVDSISDYGTRGQWTRVYNIPDTVSGSYELRQLALYNGKDLRTDFFEYYWAFYLRGTKLSAVWRWVAQLMFRTREFDRDGMIKPPPGLQGLDLEKSETSIIVYALHRMELVHERKEYYLRNIADAFNEIDGQYSANLANGMAEEQARKVASNLLNIKIDKFITLVQPDQPFSAMAKKLIESELRERYGIELAKLMKQGN